MNVSVVFPVLIKTDKQLAMTLKCIELAKKTKVPHELIIVETGTQYLTDQADIYIYEKEITTPEISHNRGFKASRGEYVSLLTNDVYVCDNWLETLLETIWDKPNCGLSTIGAKRLGHQKENKIYEDYWFDVCCIKKEVFDKVGYYDEIFVGSWCDTDLLIRAYKQGYKMYRNLNSIADGEPPQTTVGMNPNHTDNYLRGQQIFRQKHEGCGLPIYEKVK